jgi:hypothetical protein
MLAVVRQNQLFAVAVAAGTVLRLLAMVGYPGVVWFPNDSFIYLGATLRPAPDLSETVGYSFFLHALEPFHSLILVSLTQHLLGLGTAALLYLVMRRRGVAERWAVLAALPVLLDGNEIAFEHMVMADTVFTFLVAAVVSLLVWWPLPSWRAYLGAGLLAGCAITVRSAGLPLPFIVLGYLAVRRTGWQRAVAMAVGCVVPVAVYAIWFHSYSGQYALTRADGLYLWGRVSSFADCSQIRPPASERGLCLSAPPVLRPPPGQLIWLAPQAHSELPGGPVSAANDRLLRDFAFRAIAAQPVAYVHAIADGLVLAVDWHRYAYPSRRIASNYYFQLRPQTLPTNISWVPGGTPAEDARTYGQARPSRVIEPAAMLIAGYQRAFFTSGPLFAVIIAAGLGGVVRFWRQSGGPGLLPWAAAAALLIFPIAVADFSYRYLLPVLVLACLAAGLAAARPHSWLHLGNGFPAESPSLPPRASTMNHEHRTSTPSGLGRCAQDR